MKITKMFKKLVTSKKSMLFAAVAVSLVTASAGFAWGPERKTFTIEKPAEYVTFNSITNNPAYGDERNFIRLKEAGLPDSAYADDTKVAPGKEYVAYIYFHNNASITFNDAAHNFSGIARNSKIRVAMPTSLKAGERTGMTAYASADNANPAAVYDDTFMTATRDVQFKYIAGSATVHSKGAIDGQKISDSLISDGALIGYDKLDGNLPGCNEFSGYVLARFIAEAPNFTVQKLVSPTGKRQWAENISANPGDVVDFRIEYKNISTTQQDNVFILDQLPKGFEYVAGSTMLFNTQTPDGVKVSDNVTTGKGLNIGSYAAGSNAFVRFSAKLGDKSKFEVCGPNIMKNTVSVITDFGKKTDDATVTINIDCAKPIEVCSLDTKAIITIDEKNFDDKKHSRNTADCQVVAAPGELPSTGPAQTALVLAALVGTASLVVYEVQKRRKNRAAFASSIAAPTQGLLDDGIDEDEPKAEKLYVRNDDADRKSIDIRDGNGEESAFDSDETHRDEQ